MLEMFICVLLDASRNIMPSYVDFPTQATLHDKILKVCKMKLFYNLIETLVICIYFV